MSETDDGAPDKTGLRCMLNEKQVLDIVPVSPVTLWRMVKQKRFPRPSFISPNKKFWWADEIIAWQREVDGRRRGRRKHPEGGKRAAKEAARAADA
jgi:predicted DNA-binding transcriptional regulator AlpA